MEYSVDELWKMILGIGDANTTTDELDWDPYDDRIFDEKLSAIFVEKSGYRNCYFKRLRRHIVMACGIEGGDYVLYYEMISTITDRRIASQNINTLDNFPSEWRELLIASKLRVLRSKQNSDLVRELASRPLRVTESAIRIRNEFGVQCSAQEGRILIDDADKKIVAVEIEKLIVECGAQNVFECIMRHNQKIYDSNQDRYHTVRTPKIGRGFSPPPPFGYLMQLALKNWNTQRKPNSNQEQLWQRILQLTSDFLRVEDVEQHNQFEIFLSSPSELTRLLEDIAVFDTIYHFPQMNYESLMTFLNELFTWVDEGIVESRFGFTLCDVKQLVNYIDSMTKEMPHKLLHIQIDDILSSSPKLSRMSLDSMLCYFTHSTGMTNRKYILPRDHKSIDSWFKPLFTDTYGDTYLPNKHVCYVGFYESCFTIVRQCYTEAKYEHEMGTAVEELLRHVLRENNVEVYYGDFDQNGAAGDIDAAVVNETDIVLFEVKKKALTRAARSGHQYNLLIDMGLSNGKALSQLYKHEAVMLRDGYLALMNQEGRQCLQYDDKRISKIVVTLLDYGGLSDRNILKHFFEMQLQSEISVDDKATEDQVKKVEEFNEISQELRKWLKVIDPNKFDTSGYIRNWSICISYVLLALHDREENESLIDSLLYTQNISMATCDIFRERYETKKIRRVRKKLDT